MNLMLYTTKKIPRKWYRNYKNNRIYLYTIQEEPEVNKISS